MALIDRPSPSLLLRDLANGLKQQMYYWGRDVVHPKGCLFTQFGFVKRPSTGLQGTSCYRLPWQQGAIELHGSHAGWISPQGGAFFFRPIGRCVRWLSSEAPIPGRWSSDEYCTKQDSELHAALKPFLDWWLAHEEQVDRIAGPCYRENCHRAYKKLPRTRAWLPPILARQWIGALRDRPEQVSRARKFSQTIHS